VARTIGRWLVAVGRLLLAVLLLAGCGGSHAPARRPARASIAAIGCAGVPPQRPLAAWRMGAVRFLSPDVGVGITSAEFPCYGRHPYGNLVGFDRQPVRLAITHDGGQTWRPTGEPVPVGVVPGGQRTEQLLATSIARAWAIVGEGRMVQTSDGGRRWVQAPIPGPVVEIAQRGGSVWALTCPPAARGSGSLRCQPGLWRARVHDSVWNRVAVPRLVASGSEVLKLAISGDGEVMLELLPDHAGVTGELLWTTNRGRSWRARSDPRWDGQPCAFPSSLASAGARTFWLLCIGGAAAGSSAKGLIETPDGGTSWTTVAAVTSLMARPRAGSIPRMEPGTLAAGSPTRLWLSLTNGVAESNDGGRHWTGLPNAFDPGGWMTELSVLDARHAWVLAPGAGLWRTRDGLHWQPVEPLNTG
jgi:photosystem II stability/assembly factor-like uncharacterized protein